MRRKTKEEYIEIICLLEREQGRAQTGMIAEAIDVKPPSVTEMLRKLEEKGLIIYEPYAGATLTPAGLEMARDLRQRHRTFADLLGLLGVDAGTAEADACQFEHHVSPETLEHLGLFLEFLRESPEGRQSLEDFREFRRRRG
ncbi:DtxR family iron dependent repressor [Methanoculleus bourgensis MS2]|jgi:DtxR family Mn-dependent transcriptional regulator|uniref:DtxR family iron dependent repressor n=3 Tax=Methanoculleus bourgensis TaxID=83986 RepID=I7LNZ4_METBM|nr:metal-dependent transcriptional regulator [Methanoculleus bourgensis]CCJ37524.1 DtxR family iron dependent repressor [Methanoculleus bourgensis MS2]CVK34704.1 DtxR family iron dependent repressor [Methanoculleus bourgensis]